jgi:hypothetical protein
MDNLLSGLLTRRRRRACCPQIPRGGEGAGKPQQYSTPMKTLSLILSAALLLLAAACSKNTKETVTTADGGKVTLEKKGDQATMEFKGKAGEKVTLNVSETGMKPATELPKDVPLYPKAILQMDTTAADMRMLGMRTADPVADGVKFYTEELKKQGWTIDNSMVAGEGQMITAKKDKRACQLIITPDGKETYIQLVITTAN